MGDTKKKSVLEGKVKEMEGVILLDFRTKNLPPRRPDICYADSVNRFLLDPVWH